MRIIRSESLLRAVLVVVFSYLLALGATFNGAVSPQFGTISLMMLALLAAGWLLGRRGWTWYQTPLDVVFVLWALAFAISIFANPDTWRRSVIALWFMGVYVGAWYMLSDAIANRTVKRETIIESLLFAGLIPLLFGYVQVVSAIGAGVGVPRVSSTFGNPNFLAAFLLVIVPLAVGRLASIRSRVGRIILGIYAAAAALLLFLTGSRGAWLALAAEVVVFGALLLAKNDLLTPDNLRRRWRDLSITLKAAVVGLGVAALIGGVVVGALLLRSLSEPGREPDSRLYLYETALTLFAEKPLTGYGLFTYGHNRRSDNSILPIMAQSHAHNAPLHIAAELGLIGLLVLVVTLAVVFRAIRRNWRTMNDANRALLAGAAAAVVGFAVHHQLDIPSMMPAIALTGLIALVLALSPADPVPIRSRWRLIGHPVGMAALAAALLVSSLWDMSIYRPYLDALRIGVSGDPETAVTQLQTVIDADPANPIYRAQQAFFQGSMGEIDVAVVAYERLVQMEPGYAPYWANLAAMYAAEGETEKAIDAQRRAAALAPREWALHVGILRYAPDDKAALQAMLAVYPDAYLHPDLPLIADGEPSSIAEAVLHLEAGDADAALATWPETNITGYSTTTRFVVRAWIALAQNDRAAAVDYLEQARVAGPRPEDIAWLHFGQAQLAAFDGDTARAELELEQARAVVAANWASEDVVGGLSFAYAQFLRHAIPRQLLPQVFYPLASPLLAHVLEAFDINHR